MVTVTKQLDGQYEVRTNYQDGSERCYYPTFKEATKGLKDYNWVDLTKPPVIEVALNGAAIVEDYQLRRATLLAIKKRKHRLVADSQYELIVQFRKVRK